MVSSEFRKVIRNEKTDIEYREVFAKAGCWSRFATSSFTSSHVGQWIKYNVN